MYFSEALDYLTEQNASLDDLTEFVFYHLKEADAKEVDNVIKQAIITTINARGMRTSNFGKLHSYDTVIADVLPNMQILGSRRGGYGQKDYTPTPAPTDPRETFIIFSFMVEGYGLMEAISMYLDSDYVIEKATVDITLKQLKTQITDKCIEWEKDTRDLVTRRENEATYITSTAKHEAKDIIAKAEDDCLKMHKKANAVVLDAERLRVEQGNQAYDIVCRAKIDAAIIEGNLKAKIYELTSELNELENLLGQYGIVRRFVKWNKVFKRKKQEALFSFIETLTVDERNELNEYMSQYPEYTEN